MKDLEHDLENELRQLQPAPPDGSLATRLGRELDAVGPAAAPRRWSAGVRASLWASWSLTAAAAAAAAVAWWPAPVPVQSTTPTTAATTAASTVETTTPIVPVGSSNVLFGARDEGLVVLDDGRTARKVRLQYVDTVQLQDRDARSSIAVSRPREEVRFVPVSFY